MSSTWDKVMAMKAKDTRSVGVCNNLTDDELQPILGTIDFFGDNYQQDIWDLRTARYRIFDWLAMRIMGQKTEATKVLAFSFLKVDGDIDKWIYDLRTTDYDIDKSYEEVTL